MAIYAEDEVRALDEEEQLLDADTRLVCNPEEARFDLSKRRVTHLKGNARVIFPKGS